MGAKMHNNKKTVRRLKGDAGYMMIEALIAIAIFSIGFLAVATMVFSAARNNINGNILTEANILAREKMEELKSQTDLTQLDSPAAPETLRGRFTRSWTASDPLGHGTSRQVQVTISWTNSGQNQQVVMETLTQGKGL
jgi:type II secretory pathway pseudopilin PulG